jgi:hypothetical protein
MDNTLQLVKDINSDICITIIVNTHRKKPDKLQDRIALKNLIQQANARLLTFETKERTAILTEKLKKLEESINHLENQESLLLFVNEDFATYTRLPISVGNRVVIDTTFATRDLIRALHLQTNYFVLVLTEKKARLIEALSDKFVQEIGKPFPIENVGLYPILVKEKKNASVQTQYLSEFFNRIDKEVNAIRYLHVLPVFICTEASNLHEYLKIADQKHTIFPVYLKGNHEKETAQNIVSEAWKVLHKHCIEKENKRLEELELALTNGNYLCDINEIWDAIPEGRIQTLFLEENLFQSARVLQNSLILVGDEERNMQDVVDDIYDEIIEANLNHGGDVVFLPDGSLKKYKGFAAITRY